MTKYDKLIRDLIPDIIRKKGIEPVIRLASAEEYRTKLREKLQEEVNEYLESGSSEELADILEVVHALGALENHGPEHLERLRVDKAAERGAFKKGIILLES